MLKILLSNDDGVYAPGLRALASKLSEIADVTVVAPDRNRSGASNSLTLDNPLRVKELEDGFYSVNGTPTDCVHIGVTGMLDVLPDMVISGVNHGENLGDDILYSGTIAAATEGRFLGLPSMAVSLASKSIEHLATATESAKNIVLHLKENPVPPDTILSVNIPDLPISELKGFQITRLGTRHCAAPSVKTKDPRGRTIYWVGEAGSEKDDGPGTDFHAVRSGYVSITPLKIDLTHNEVIDQLVSWVDKIKL